MRLRQKPDSAKTTFAPRYKKPSIDTVNARQAVKQVSNFVCNCDTGIDLIQQKQRLLLEAQKPSIDTVNARQAVKLRHADQSWYAAISHIYTQVTLR